MAVEQTITFANTTRSAVRALIESSPAFSVVSGYFKENNRPSSVATTNEELGGNYIITRHWSNDAEYDQYLSDLDSANTQHREYLESQGLALTVDELRF